MSTVNSNYRNVRKGHDLTNFQTILRQKCQQQMRDRRIQLFNKGRSGLLPTRNVQETLTEIVRQEFKKLAATESPGIVTSTITIINYPLSQDEALEEENKIIAEQEQWILQEYERMLNNEEEMFDIPEDETICPMCQKSFLEEIPDFIVCNFCGLKLKSDISLLQFKYNLDLYIDTHSRRCFEVPNFSLTFENNNTSLCMSCSACSSSFLLETIVS